MLVMKHRQDIEWLTIEQIHEKNSHGFIIAQVIDKRTNSRTVYDNIVGRKEEFEEYLCLISYF